MLYSYNTGRRPALDMCGGCAIFLINNWASKVDDPERGLALKQSRLSWYRQDRNYSFAILLLFFSLIEKVEQLHEHHPQRYQLTDHSKDNYNSFIDRHLRQIHIEQ